MEDRKLKAGQKLGIDRLKSRKGQAWFADSRLNGIRTLDIQTNQRTGRSSELSNGGRTPVPSSSVVSIRSSLTGSGRKDSEWVSTRNSSFIMSRFVSAIWSRRSRF